MTKAAGNPFFVEELTWAARGAGDPAGTLALPDTVQAVLAARIDRLPAGGQAPAPDRRGHWHRGALCRCCRPLPELPEDGCTAAWRTSRRPSSSTRRSLFPERAYTFKHALTHEVAYGSLLQERRRALHARIVEALEALSADRLAEQVERLAHHALRGEVWDKALAYCRQAGEKAMARSAYPRGGGVFRAGADRLAASPRAA